MVQIIAARQNQGPTKGEKFDQFLNMANQAYQGYAQKKLANEQYNQENETIKKLTGFDPTGIRDPKMRQRLLELSLEKQFAETPEDKFKQEKQKIDYLKQKELEKQKALSDYKFGQKKSFFDKVLNKSTAPSQQRGVPFKLDQQQSPSNEMPTSDQSMQQGFDPTTLTDEDIVEMSLFDPNAARLAQSQKDAAIAQKREQDKIDRQNKKEDREFHTSYSKDAVKEVESLRSSIPRLQMSLDFARDAIESGEVGRFTLANLGQRLGMPELQTAKGAQLVTAAKENLLGNMSRVSSRAQNKWFEQRLNSMMAQVGQTEEANLSAQEMLEAEAAMGQSYVNEFDRLSEEDMKNYGYEKKDIAKRARSASKTLENHIFNRASYRLKEIEEGVKDNAELKSKVGKNVTNGTPLTKRMAKLYSKKFGDNALDVAKKNGYYIPTYEEYKSFSRRPREFREELDYNE